MLSKILRFLSQKPEATEPSPEEAERHHEMKRQWLEALLGPMHDIVGHAIFPFAVGGAVDMYYFPQPVGTAFATMELIRPDGSGPRPSRIGTYELTAFTRHSLSEKDGDAFNQIERRFCGIFTRIGFYTEEAVLNPGETCEIPAEDDEPNRCLIFDHYTKAGIDFRTGKTKHGLLLCIEVFPSEMDHARAKSAESLLGLLKTSGHYPFSDLERPPVA